MDVFTKILLDGLKAQTKDAKFPSKEEQAKRLTAFLETSSEFKVGDEVVRNTEGEVRYKFPNKDQVAVVSRVLDTVLPEDDGDSLVDMEIITLVPHDDGFRVRTFTVDSRYYKKA